MYAENQVVSVANIAEVQSDGKLLFVLPPSTEIMAATVRHISYENDTTLTDSTFSWLGKVEGYEDGELFIMQKNYAVGGYIRYGENFYSLMPLGGEQALLLKHSPEWSGAGDCGMQSPLEPDDYTGAESIPSCDEMSNCSATVDVLMLVSEPAQDFLDGMGNFFSMPAGNLWLAVGAEVMNVAMINSEIQNKKFRFRTVPNFAFNFSTVNNGLTPITQHLKRLSTDVQVAALRSQYKADVVLLITNQSYSDARGLAVNPGDGPDYEEAFAIVEVKHLLSPTFTLAHELSHIFNARHNTGSNVGSDIPAGSGDNANFCHHGLRFKDSQNKDRFTLMAVLNNTGQRLTQLSNPDVFFDGIPTGLELANNAKAIANNACRVASFEPNPEMSVHIRGRNLWCKYFEPEPIEDEMEFHADIIAPAAGFAGGGPYTYEWRYNTNMFSASSPGIYLANTPSITLPIIFVCPYFFLRLKVTSADGVVRYSTRKVDVSLCPDCQWPGGGRYAAQTTPTLLGAYPNPAQQLLTLSFSSPTEITNVRVTDMMGRLIHLPPPSSNLVAMKEYTWDIAHLPVGLYHIAITQNNTQQTITFIKE